MTTRPTPNSCDACGKVPYETLDEQSRRDVLFSQLIEDPERYRGLPIHIEGTALRTLVHEVKDSNVTPRERLYEVWAVTRDSQDNPYVLVFEDPPRDIALGDEAWGTRITFDGYFLKLMAYLAGDKKVRVAPMIVGRFPPPSKSAGQLRKPWQPFGRMSWPILLLLVVSLFAVVRLLLYMRRVFRGPSLAGPLTAAPRDQIKPEELDEWVHHQQDHDEDEEEDDALDRDWDQEHS